MNVVNVGYDSTNYYVVGKPGALLLVDVGWPGTLPKLLANLARKDIPLTGIRYLLATHYHPDHAGIAQEVKAKGVRLIVLEQQLAAIPLLKGFMKPSYPFVGVTLHDNVRLATDESRAFLGAFGVGGEIVHTPGHSDDSVTLVLDDGLAFTGDLPPRSFVEEGSEVARSWDRIRALGATTIYPGHGPAPKIISAAP